MPGAIQSIQLLLLEALMLLRDRRVQVCAIAAIGLTLLAGVVAPDSSAGGWDWFRFVIVLAVALPAVLILVESRDDTHDPAQQQSRLLGVATLVHVAIVTNATFGILPTLLFSVGFSIVALEAMRDRRGRAPWLMCVLLTIFVPFWVWSALDAWNGGLLLLIPLAGLALISDGHIRSASIAGRANSGTVLTGRGHRLGSWIGVLLASLLVLVVALLSSISNTWAALGAIGAIVLIAIEAGIAQSDTRPRQAILIIDVALAWIAIAWLVSL